MGPWREQFREQFDVARVALDRGEAVEITVEMSGVDVDEDFRRTIAMANRVNREPIEGAGPGTVLFLGSSAEVDHTDRTGRASYTLAVGPVPRGQHEPADIAGLLDAIEATAKATITVSEDAR